MDPKQPQRRVDSSWSALSFAWELGYSIVIPLVVLLAGGVFFDHRFGTSPRFTFIGVGVSFVTTIVMLIVKVRSVIADFDTSDVSNPNKQEGAVSSIDKHSSAPPSTSIDSSMHSQTSSGRPQDSHSQSQSKTALSDWTRHGRRSSKHDFKDDSPSTRKSE